MVANRRLEETVGLTVAGGASTVYVARVNGLSDRTTVQNIAAILGGHMTDAPDERPKQQLIGPRGRFLPGNKFGRGRGRPKGALNKATVGMKALMNATAEKHGSDGKGKDGVGGYMDYLAKTFPEAFAHHRRKKSRRTVKAAALPRLPSFRFRPGISNVPMDFSVPNTKLCLCGK